MGLGRLNRVQGMVRVFNLTSVAGSHPSILNTCRLRFLGRGCADTNIYHLPLLILILGCGCGLPTALLSFARFLFFLPAGNPGNFIVFSHCPSSPLFFLLSPFVERLLSTSLPSYQALMAVPLIIAENVNIKI